MNEAGVRRELYTLLKEIGYWPTRGRDAIICPRCNTAILPPMGRPDLLVLSPKGRSRVLEVKAINTERTISFAFSQIEDDQRRWLNAWYDAGGLGYLGIGTYNERPRRLWLVDWEAWLQVEAKLSGIQQSIPIDSSISRTRKIVSEQHLDMVTLLADYELVRKTGGWDAPTSHSILKFLD